MSGPPAWLWTTSVAIGVAHPAQLVPAVDESKVARPQLISALGAPEKSIAGSLASMLLNWLGHRSVTCPAPSSLRRRGSSAPSPGSSSNTVMLAFQAGEALFIANRTVVGASTLNL